MEHTIAAISTSTMSSGGISIVRMSGKDAIETADKIFVSKNGKNCLKPAAILFIMEILLMKTVIL